MVISRFEEEEAFSVSNFYKKNLKLKNGNFYSFIPNLNSSFKTIEGLPR